MVETAATLGTRVDGREYLQCRASFVASFRRCDDVDNSFADCQGGRQQLLQVFLPARFDLAFTDRQFNVVFLVPVEPRPLRGRHHLAVDPEVFVAFAAGPFGELGVVPLARHDQRCQYQDTAAGKPFHDPCPHDVG